MNRQIPEISPVTSSDTGIISSLAREIWLQHYKSMLSIEQINYMLAQRYCPMLIHAQLTDKKVWWKKLVLGDAVIGFSCCLRIDEPDVLKIDKLYIHPGHHCKGYGKMLIDDAIKTMHEIACSKLILTVNKQNHSAINAYQRLGFKIIGDSIVDIGDGFFMNDYLMSMTQFGY